MTVLTLSRANPADAAVDALVVGVYSGDDGPVVADERLADSAAALAGVGATGKAGEVVRIPAPDGVAAGSLVGVGLGARADVTPERIRKGAGAATRALAGVETLGSLLGLLDLTAAAEGHLLGAYQFDRYKTPAKATAETVTVFVTDDSADVETVLRRAMIGAEAVCLARDLINTAPNDLPPAVFADRAAAAAKEAGLSVEVLDERALARDGYGGILGVGSGSTRPPRLVRLAWTPRNRAPRWPWSARASPSTPAASPSSRRRTWSR